MSAQVDRHDLAERIAQAEWWVDQPVAPVDLLLVVGILEARPEGIEKLSPAEVAERLIVRTYKGRGRPRQLSGRTFLIGLYLAASREGTRYLEDAYRELVSLPLGTKIRLGVCAPSSTTERIVKELTERQFSYLWAVLVDRIDPEPVPARRGGREAWPERFAAAQPPEDEAGVLRTWRQVFQTTLLCASLPTERRAQRRLSAAVDWTDIDAWAIPSTADNRSAAADPFAKWGHRRRKAPGGKHEPFYGYNATAAALVRGPSDDTVAEPVVFSALLPASEKESADVWLSVTALAVLQQFGLDVRPALADMAYPNVPGWAQA
ncbi:MAG: hypothetical protein ACRDGL_05930, partial [Candidatus Limnocylindrales bacterium]